MMKPGQTPPRHYEGDLNKENFDLIAKVIELIAVIGWSDDDTYTFADGDRWYKFNPKEDDHE